MCFLAWGKGVHQFTSFLKETCLHGQLRLAYGNPFSMIAHAPPRPTPHQNFRVSPSSWFIQEAKISMCVFGKQGSLDRSVPQWIGVILNTRRIVWSLYSVVLVLHMFFYVPNTTGPLWRPYHFCMCIYSTWY